MRYNAVRAAIQFSNQTVIGDNKCNHLVFVEWLGNDKDENIVIKSLGDGSISAAVPREFSSRRHLEALDWAGRPLRVSFAPRAFLLRNEGFQKFVTVPREKLLLDVRPRRTQKQIPPIERVDNRQRRIPEPSNAWKKSRLPYKCKRYAPFFQTHGNKLRRTRKDTNITLSESEFFCQGGPT